MVGGERRTEIQWLRALAAIEVVVCHSDLVTKHFAGYQLAGSWWHTQLAGIGVELFFIVSGYVICMRAPTYASGGAFLLSRIRRLFPMYWVFTSLVLLAYVVNPAWRLNNFDPGPLSVLQSYLILPQWGWPILGVGWTLEQEMMFYGFVALAMLVWSMKGSARMAVAWSLAGMGFIGAQHGPEPGSSLWGFHAFSPFMFAFGFGWLLRCVEEMDQPGRLWNVALFASIVGTTYIVGTETGDRLVLRIALAAVVFCAFIACRRLFEADSKLNRSGWLLGDASYSIYLCHWFVLSAMGKVLGVMKPPAATAELVRFLGVALSAAIGVWIFVAMEKPIDRWLRRGASPAEIPWPRLASLSWQNISRRF